MFCSLLLHFGTSSPNISLALGIEAGRMNSACAPCCSRPEVRGTPGSFLPSRISFQSHGEDQGPNSEFTNGSVSRVASGAGTPSPTQSPTLENSRVELEYKLPVRKSGGLCPGGDGPAHNPRVTSSEGVCPCVRLKCWAGRVPSLGTTMWSLIKLLTEVTQT